MANIQFNAKEAKSFRATCEKYYKSRHAMAEALTRFTDDYNSARVIFDNSTADIIAMDAGEYVGHRTREEVEADITTMRDRMNTAKDAMEQVKVDQKTAIDNGLALYTDGMHKAAERVVAEFGSETALADWRQALADMLDANGVHDATAENVVRFDFTVNVKASGNKKTVITGSSIGVGAKRQSAILFMNSFVEYLTDCGIISPFKHKYIPLSEKKRLERKAQ